MYLLWLYNGQGQLVTIPKLDVKWKKLRARKLLSLFRQTEPDQDLQWRTTRKAKVRVRVRTVVLLAIFGVLGVMNGVIGNGWERDFVLLRRVTTLLPLLPFPLAAWT